MKKLVALAVAGAFVAPVYAADVSVSGDVEYRYYSVGAGSYFDSGDQDVVVKASETLANGIAVSVSLEMDGVEDSFVSDSVLTLKGGFGSIEIGDAVDAAQEKFDEKSDVAEAGGTSGEAASTTTHAVTYTPNLGIDGMTAAVTFGTTTAVAATAKNVTSYALQYSTSGLSIAYGTTDAEGQTETLDSISLSYAFGPFYIGYDNISSVGYVKGTDRTNFGLTYSYGPGKLYVESGETGASGAKTETTAMGISYKMGSVNLFAELNDIEVPATPANNDEQTIVGIEYSF